VQSATVLVMTTPIEEGLNVTGSLVVIWVVAVEIPGSLSQLLILNQVTVIGTHQSGRASRTYVE
jgi:hypothetical protein